MGIRRLFSVDPNRLDPLGQFPEIPAEPTSEATQRATELLAHPDADLFIATSAAKKIIKRSEAADRKDRRGRNLPPTPNLA